MTNSLLQIDEINPIGSTTGSKMTESDDVESLKSDDLERLVAADSNLGNNNDASEEPGKLARPTKRATTMENTVTMRNRE